MKDVAIKSSHNHTPFNPLEIQARCPKCHSVFIEDDHCESCSYQLNFDLLGSPFDNKSFYSQVELFKARGPLLYRFSNGVLGQNHKLFRKHKRAMKKRFYDLSEYIFERVDNDKERRKMFLFELEQIIPYLLKLGVHEEELYVLFERHTKHPLSQRLFKKLNESVDEKVEEQSPVALLLNYKINNMLKVSFLLQAILMGVSMSLAAYMFSKFLASAQ
ncbi:hypothetical protein OAT67_07715 [Bacteriovoracaceae bacterium]|nr:hypothetical protein [Bacteriovoracaceae bacterium]